MGRKMDSPQGAQGGRLRHSQVLQSSVQTSFAKCRKIPAKTPSSQPVQLGLLGHYPSLLSN